MDKDRDNFIGTLSFRSQVRLLLLYPFPPPQNEEGPFVCTENPFLMPKTQVDELYCIGAPSTYSDSHDIEKASPIVVAKAKWAESQGYNAMVVGCMVDPGVQEAKDAVNIPLIGIRESARAVALLIGKNIGQIYPEDISVFALSADEEKTYSELVKAGRWLITKRGVDVLIPNCAFIGGMAQRLQSELGVPVLPNVDIGLKIAELLASLNVRPEQSWVEAERAPKVNQILSRMAWQMRHWFLRH